MPQQYIARYEADACARMYKRKRGFCWRIEGNDCRAAAHLEMRGFP